MNKTVIEMALDAGFEEIAFHKEGDSDFVCFTDEIEKFAELVRADEREACAKVCDDIDAEYEGEDVLATWCSQAIRARSET